VDEPKVIEPATRLLSAIGFTGLVEVEFKEDLRNGEYKVLDVNPRVWGWHTLSRRAGVDFPYLLWLLVKGDPVPEARGRAGECWMHMSADLPMAFQEIRKGRLSLMAYLRSLLKPMESAIFAWDDPAPGLLDLPLLAWTLAKRFLRRDGN
jgi:predicted ATP-grasp superfamily ATP-dependent carboligase